MSLRASLANAWLRRVERRALRHLAANPPTRARQRFEWQMRLVYGRPRQVRPVELAGIKALALGPESETRLLYFHGGGYLIGSPLTHQGMVARLCARAGIGAFLPDYPLAPEHPFPAAIEAALAAYREVASRGPVILGGDSAGGGLALALLGEICRLGLPQPLVSFAFSPWTDLELTGASLHENAPREVLLPPDRLAEARDLYLAGAAPDDPRASPLRAEFHGAAPVRLWVGDHEILADDSRRMDTLLTSQGVDSRLRIGHDLPHAWPLAPGWLLPESRQTLAELAGEIQALLPRASL